MAIHSSNRVLKFVETTIEGLITNNDEAVYRGDAAPVPVVFREQPGVQHTKIKEIIVDYRKSRRTVHIPFIIQGEGMEYVDNIKFLGVHITLDLIWSLTTCFLTRKGPTKTLLPQVTEKGWIPCSVNQKILQSHN